MNYHDAIVLVTHLIYAADYYIRSEISHQRYTVYVSTHIRMEQINSEFFNAMMMARSLVA